MTCSVADAVERTGITHRSLQRWCRVHIGLPLRTYLRLLRFQETLGDVGTGSATLAGTAAERGYADQPHMARAFRDFAGTSATAVSSLLIGPFVAHKKAPRR